MLNPHIEKEPKLSIQLVSMDDEEEKVLSPKKIFKFFEIEIQ